MVFINLLPVRDIKRRIRAKQQIITFIAGFCCLLVALGALGFLQWQKEKGLASELTRLKQQRQQYAARLAKIKKLEADKALLEKRIAVIHTLKSKSSLTVHLMDEVARLTPTKRMWLTSMEQSGGSLKISGMALDNQTLAAYMETLKKSPYIKAVNLTRSSLKKYAGRDLTSFGLTCSVGMPTSDTNNQAAKSNK